MSRPLPVMFVGDARSVLLVGGGAVATEKLEKLLFVGIVPTIIAAEVSPGLRALAETAGARVFERAFAPGDTKGYALTIVATGAPEVAKAVYDEVMARGAMINSADDPAHSNAFLSADLHEGDLTIAVSTHGASAGYAAFVRNLLRAAIPRGASKVLPRLRALRERLKAEGGASKQAVAGRKRFLNDLIRGGAQGVLASDVYDEDALAGRFAQGQSPEDRVGEVILVGAGPGDPSLLTLAGAEAIARADVVLYDALVHDDVLALARPDAVLEFVGKRAGGEYTPQPKIEARLVELASQGKVVARLKGGDPFVFGRGSEEWRTLAKAGVRVSHTSGVTSAIAALSAAGFAVTERERCDAVFLTTGHRSVSPGTRLVPAFDPGLLVIVLMSKKAMTPVCQSFLERGWDPRTPAAVISHGTLPDQEVLEAPLGAMAALVAEREPRTPALLAVGEVMGHRITR